MTIENGSQNNSPQWKDNASGAKSPPRDEAPKSSRKKRGDSEGVWGARRRADVPRAPVPQGGGGGGGGERDLNFFDILGILRRQIWIVVLMTIVGGALAVYKYTVTPKEYESRVEIYFPSASASALLRSYDQTSAAGNQTKIDNIETLSTVIVSDVILEPVSDALLGKYRQDAPRFEEQFNARVASSAKLVAESREASAALAANNANKAEGAKAETDANKAEGAKAETDADDADKAEDAKTDKSAKKDDVKRANSLEAKERRRKKAIAIGMLRKMLSVKKGGTGAILKTRTSFRFLASRSTRKKRS
ncbi:MAG: hypothetical protein IJO46_09725 [Thermoguttaceae bacterium]|nr:hypothetical protein [Thermoguttaceae bacterium]